MFCPNCGTQNPETAATCSKCTFNLKGAAAPKFKGTMLMMNNPRTPAGPPAAPAPPPAAPAPPGAGPMPSKLKGTMVGVAPPVGAPAPPPQAPIAPRPPSIPPPPDIPPPPAYLQQVATQAFASPPGPPFGSPINPLGGTIAADNPNQYPQVAQAQGQRPGGAFGKPSSGGDFGAPPPQDWNAPPPMGGAQMQGGAMQPYAGQGGPMMRPQGAPIQPGAHGAKGTVRNPMMVLLWSLVSFGFYQLWWFIVSCIEMSTYLQREEPTWWKVVLFSSVTCGAYGLYWQLTRCGALVQEMQQRAGLPNPENKGILYLVPVYNVMLLQEELNKVWQSPQ